MEVLCSCLYIPTDLHESNKNNNAFNQQNNHHNIKEFRSFADQSLPDEIIRTITVSDSEDILIGKSLFPAHPAPYSSR